MYIINILNIILYIITVLSYSLVYFYLICSYSPREISIIRKSSEKHLHGCGDSESILIATIFFRKRCTLARLSHNVHHNHRLAMQRLVSHALTHARIHTRESDNNNKKKIPHARDESRACKKRKARLARARLQSC